MYVSAHVCVWVIRVTQLSFSVGWVDGDIVLSLSRALEYAGSLCCPSARSAFLALSYNGALLHTLMLSSLSESYSLNSSSQERLASQCRIHGKRHIVKDHQWGIPVTSEQRWSELFGLAWAAVIGILLMLDFRLRLLDNPKVLSFTDKQFFFGFKVMFVWNVGPTVVWKFLVLSFEIVRSVCADRDRKSVV